MADSNGDSNSSDQRQATAIGNSAAHSHNPRQLGICPASLAEGHDTRDITVDIDIDGRGKSKWHLCALAAWIFAIAY
jgi:hypothetical protein